MKRFIGCLAALALLAVLLPAGAGAESHQGMVAQVTYWTAQDGMGDEFEAGLKKHNELHVAQADPMAIHTWEVVTGKRVGEYIRASFGHHWADLDAAGENLAADEADSAKNIAPYLESALPMIYSVLPGISRFPAGGPSGVTKILTFNVRPGKQGVFLETIGKIHAAIEKTDYIPSYIWYQREDGGRVPTYVVALPRANWAAFEPSDKPMPAMLTEVYGAEETAKILGGIAEAVESQWSETAVHRADLSYVPASE